MQNLHRKIKPIKDKRVRWNCSPAALPKLKSGARYGMSDMKLRPHQDNAALNFILAMAIFPEQRTKSNNAIKLHMDAYRGSTWLPLPMTIAAAVE